MGWWQTFKGWLKGGKRPAKADEPAWRGGTSKPKPSSKPIDYMPDIEPHSPLGLFLWNKEIYELDRREPPPARSTNPRRSSNVRSIRYLAEDKTMEVVFLNGSVYHIPSFTEAMAYSFVTAASKGGWYYDNIKTTGHPYVFLTAGGGYVPKWARKSVRAFPKQKKTKAKK